MIFANELVLTLTHLVGANYYLIGAIYGTSPSLALGPAYCKVNQVIITLGCATRITGGAGMALMRLLYIRYQQHMMDISELTASTLILMLTQGLAVLMTIAWVTSPQPNNTVINFCLGISDLQSHIIFDYEGLQESIAPKVVVGVAMAATLCELAIYSRIYLFLLRHDSKMLAILPEGTIRQRFRRNAVELSSHLFYFAYELLAVLAFTISVMYTRGNSRLLGVLFCLFFGLFYPLRIAVSPNLKNELRLLMGAFGQWVNGFMRPTLQQRPDVSWGPQKHNHRNKIHPDANFQNELST